MIVAKTEMKKIPDYCCECFLLSDETGLFSQFKPYDYCGVTGEKIDDLFLKPEWCPLILVKDDKLE